MPQKRPKPWFETSRGLTRCVWRFQGVKYRTPHYEDSEEARADATKQIDDQINGTWQDQSGSRMLLEKWIDEWRALLPSDLAKKTFEKYKYY